MKNHQIQNIFFTFLLFLWSPDVRAELTSSVDFNIGASSLNLKAQDFSKTFSSSSTIEINYALKHPSASTAYVLSFAEALSAEGKKLPYTLFAVGARYYPSGFSGYRLILDQGAEARVWKPTPFIGMNLGIANISIEELNATVIDISPRFGVELPISPTFLAQAQLVLQAASSAGNSEQSSISYTGISAYLGLILADF